MEKYDIYVSYIHFVEEQALKISEMLKNQGFTVSLHDDPERSGSTFENLYRRIDRCTHFIFLADASTFGPKHFHNHLELAYAIARNKRIIPVIMPSFGEVSNNMHYDVAPISKYHCLGFCKSRPVSSYRTILNMVLHYHDNPETRDNGLSDGVFYPNGDRYYGGISNGKRNGFGRLFFYFGGCYEGEWKDDVREGYGSSKDFMDYVYEGEWKDNRYNGMGVLKTSDFKYEGEFKDGNPCGRGTLYYYDSTHITGTFDENFSGIATGYYISGERYDGEYVREKRDGFGINVYPDGSCYKGEWKNDKKHGAGVFVHPGGIEEQQQWNDGELVKKTKS